MLPLFYNVSMTKKRMPPLPASSALSMHTACENNVVWAVESCLITFFP